MNIQELNEKAPSDYPKCLQADCPAADQCLRNLMGRAVSEKAIVMTVINPKNLKPELGTSCPYFHSTQPMRMARGFTKALDNVRHGEVKKIVAELSQLFDERLYYRFRKGERLINPQQQAIIAEVLTRHGASQPVEFDSYEEGYNWVQL
ncbi:MAG: hypothetical protein IKT26_02720 [Bacteroidaceae bacterium]|nr:hypothetical protein [Bacteroidaceae bacterium]